MKFLSLYLLILSFVYGQVNIENVRHTTKQDGIQNKLGVNWNISNGNTTFSLLNLNYRVDSVSDKKHSFAIFSLSQGHSGNTIIKDRGFMHLRHVYKKSTRYSLEGYLQNEYNKFIDLSNRKLIGAGLRIPHHDTPQWSMYSGHSIMLETEQYENHKTTNLVRLSEYLTVRYTSLFSTLSTIVYFQPALSDFQDFRVLSDIKWLIPISEHVSLKSSATIRYDNEPENDISNFDIDTTTGLELTF